MSNVIKLHRTRTFVVKVVFDSESSMWVAVCDDLTLATEALTYDALVKRVWEIAPEIAHENALPFDAHTRLSFRQVTTAASLLRVG